ncbi:MAG: LCP family protein [Bacilli bacterium]|jgi:LCP family protein required for cell wall assembly
MQKIFYFLNKFNISKLKFFSIVFLLILYIISFLLFTGSILQFSGIETLLRLIIIIILFLITCLFVFSSLKLLINKNFFLNFLYLFFLFIFGSSQLFGAYYINKIYTSISNISQERITYETSLISLVESDINKIEEVKKKKIGIINDKESIDGYVISQEIIKEYNLTKTNTLVKFNNFIALLNALYDEEVDLIFIPGDYKIIFSNERFEKIAEETKVIFSKKKTVNIKKTINKKLGKNLKEPFTLLIMGVDSTHDDINTQTAFNGDALMVLTFNPNTLNTTILSIPRDTFVPIMCFKNQRKNKITHAAWYGESCMIKTIENFTGIDIDYYLKVNFKAVVKLVDALGGVEVNVPYSLCEQNSNRQWGENTVFVEKGKHLLNGEQALALSRNRRRPNDGSSAGYFMSKNCPTYNEGNRNDYTRGENQQLVLEAIFNKLQNVKNIQKITDILEILGKNINSNLSTEQILSFYNIGKEILSMNKQVKENKDITFEKLYLSGYGRLIYDEEMKRELSNFLYYDSSLKDVVTAMKINLELISPVLIKSFKFSINEPFTIKIIGKGPYYGEKTISQLPNFIGKSKEYALNWGQKNNIKINFEVVDSHETKDKQDQIIKQSIPAATLMELINKNKGLTLTIINKVEPKIEKPAKINCNLEEYEDTPLCLMPNFLKEDINKITEWENSIVKNFIVTLKKTITQKEEEHNIIFEQSVEPGTKVKDIPLEIVINHYYYEKEIEEDVEEEINDPENTEEQEEE